MFDYEIAVEIGGYKALQNLKYRCLQRGIRLASDMVPNHTGIDSKWVRENPDWFVSLPNSPFPSYTFNGTNLSTDPRYGIFIEDNYYSRTDAAVVFKKQDYWTGDVKYIYHGNDGTNMPWNDTAQLNFLNPEVREAVIQNILRVAHSFSIIRFDAAMTLTKKHYQRLWFPAPGSGGDIPTRSEHGLSKGDFNKAMTNEFWREVVDRIAEEAPDTLLLAEAFWLMEGYFVRTLGMHRVYNSAFMNMLKNEENEKYRNTIKNTIQFNPEILKRFVNFMNNPDEETALAQFGKSDKYFGVCTMVVTMPGLPMFGHGQVEGFVEKYGMEYRRAYLDEQVDWELVDRHEREIFPLMKKRYLFANVDDFLFYDFSTEENVNENVFAYSNRFGNEYALVVYNNKFAEAKGWIHTSVQYASKTGTNGDTHLKQKNLGSALNLHSGENNYCIFQDEVTGLEFIRKSNEILEQGLYFELGAYKYFVALNFREVLDNDLHQYEQLAASLNGRGVASISEALQELFLQPLSEAFDSLLSVEKVKEFKKHSLRKKPPAGFLKNFEKSSVLFLKQARHFSS
ncbi:MAG: alpha-amylase family glycosyl hydrolase, partial [Nitrospinaceae bacterium]